MYMVPYLMDKLVDLFCYFNASMPDHLKTIVLNFGGRFYDNRYMGIPGDGLFYCGTTTRYLHYIDLWWWNIAASYQTIIRILRDLNEDVEAKLPHMMWYLEHGPGERKLRVIQFQDDLVAMWANADEHGKQTVDIMMQDREIEMSADGKELVYAIPQNVPAPRGRFYWEQHYELAKKAQAHDNQVGTAKLGLCEYYADTWYISEDPKPRAPVITGVKLRPLKNRRMSSISICDEVHDDGEGTSGNEGN